MTKWNAYGRDQGHCGELRQIYSDSLVDPPQYIANVKPFSFTYNEKSHKKENDWYTANDTNAP